MTWANLFHFPDLPEVPEAVRGGSYVVVMAAHQGTEAEGRRLLRPLRDLGPEIDTLAMVPPIALGELAMDPPDPLPYKFEHHLLDDVPAAGIDALLQAAGPGSAAGTALTVVQMRHMGGALARKAPGAGARATLPGSIALAIIAVVPDEATAAVVDAGLAGVEHAVAPYRVGDYPNFVEERTDASHFFDAETWQRLRAVKELYDPTELFRANHEIPPARGELDASLAA
jgi:hypothetical protein